ncbi:MAG: hypothetical protein QOJ52_2836 [Acidimicrobiaceae bacterium]|nr:hypothetical protein [Acidimicrobiaceae bacterium]
MIRAQPSSARAVTRLADHSGCSAGSGSVTMPAATPRRASWLPGGGQRTSWTCRVMSNSGSSTQTGRPQPGGVDTSFWRNRGMPRIRPPGHPGPHSRPDACQARRRGSRTWSGAGPTSEASSPMSIALARSTVTTNRESAAGGRRRIGGTARRDNRAALVPRSRYERPAQQWTHHRRAVRSRRRPRRRAPTTVRAVLATPAPLRPDHPPALLNHRGLDSGPVRPGDQW